LGPNSHLFRFENFHSQLYIWCPIMPKPAILPPNRLTLWIALLIQKSPWQFHPLNDIPHIEIILVIMKFESLRIRAS
jgi:hypothetical protein